MESDSLKRWLRAPVLTVLAGLVCAFAAGFSLSAGRDITACGLCGAALGCVAMSIAKFRRVTRHLDYLVQATVNGDFSYRFPVTGVSKHEQEANKLLNNIVVHIEKLAAETRNNERFLSLVIDLVDHGIIVSDEKGNVRHCNKAALRMLGMHVLTNIRRIPADCLNNFNVTHTHASLNGEEMTITTLTDIRKPVQSAEVESWEKLTRVLTHEIMNSLTPITSISETLWSDYKGHPLEEPLGVIKSSSEALATFVKNFRVLTRLPEPSKAGHYVRDLLHGTASLLLSSSECRHIEIAIDVKPTDMIVYTDANLLRQVLVNLVKNAVEASPGHIWIRACIENDESVCITVSNDGEAIPEEIASQVFVPFFTTRHDGDGIGLSLSRRIITHLGGTLTLTTRPATCFTILLP